MKNNSEIIRKIINSFPSYTYEMETTKWDWLIYLWNKHQKIFFELPIVTKNKNDETLKAKILLNNELKSIENKNIDFLIDEIKDLINEKERNNIAS